VGGDLPDFAEWSGYPSIAAFLINPGIDAMSQKQTFLLVLRVIRSDIIQLRDGKECALNH